MALQSLLNRHSANLISKLVTNFEVSSIRHGHHIRGLPPGVARSLDQKLEEINYKDPELFYRVDIGFPIIKPDKTAKAKQMEILKTIRKDMNMERESRKQTLRVDLKEVNDEWVKTVGPQHIKMIADHYAIFEHLFGEAYFHPSVPMTVSFVNDDFEVPVHYGNVIRPCEATTKPNVTYTSEKNSLWSLVLTNLDGHFTDNNKEYVHWFVGNIPEINIEKGETIVNYLQPFPPRGTGYHRFAFVLYKQEKKLDFSSLKPKSVNDFDLEARTFSTLDFYRERQDDLTPAGLSFFQSHWDKSLTDFYHNKLEMKEPRFEYDFDPPYIRPQTWFPIRQPFNLYMDKYRDPKQINKEFLQRKLKNVHPFKDPPAPIPFPNAEPWSKPYIPSWLKLEITKSRLKWGRVNDIE